MNQEQLRIESLWFELRGMGAVCDLLCAHFESGNEMPDQTISDTFAFISRTIYRIAGELEGINDQLTKEVNRDKVY